MILLISQYGQRWAAHTACTDHTFFVWPICMCYFPSAIIIWMDSNINPNHNPSPWTENSTGTYNSLSTWVEIIICSQRQSFYGHPYSINQILANIILSVGIKKVTNYTLHKIYMTIVKAALCERISIKYVRKQHKEQSIDYAVIFVKIVFCAFGYCS